MKIGIRLDKNRIATDCYAASREGHWPDLKFEPHEAELASKLQLENSNISQTSLRIFKNDNLQKVVAVDRLQLTIRRKPVLESNKFSNQSIIVTNLHFLDM